MHPFPAGSPRSRQVSLRWRVKHGRDLVVKVPAGDFANCGQELHCGRDDPYPDIPVFQDLPDHDSIRYIEALDALSAKMGSEGDLSAFPLNVVGALNPARGFAVVMNELFKAWLFWSGVGANIVGVQLPGQPGSPPHNGARGVASSSDFFEPEAAAAYRGRTSGSFRNATEPTQRPGSRQSYGAGGGGGGSFREGGPPAGGSQWGPPEASGSRRAQSGRFEAPTPQPPASRASYGSRITGGGYSRGNSLTGRG